MLLSTQDWQALWLTLQLACISTLLLLVISTPLAWWLANSRSKTKTLVETLVALPLVLPPTVLGFYLLVALGPNGWIGAAAQTLGLPALIFSFSGLVIGSVIYSLPFVVQPIQQAFASLGRQPVEMAATLGASPLDQFVSVVLPLSVRGYMTGAALGFAHTLGEFGVVLMIGGNIPGKTQLVSMSIYDHVSALDYASANALSLILLVFSFVLLFGVYRLNQRLDLVRP